MSSFLGWNTSETNDQSTNSTESNNQHLLRIAVSTAGVDNHSTSANIQSPVISGNKQSNSSDNGDGSDYILDSDECGSDASPRCDKVEDFKPPHVDQMHNHTDVQIQYNDSRLRKRCDKSLTKVSSTGNLRVYHKTDLKNKINAVEHRLLMMEKRLQNIEKSCNIQNEATFSVPAIIKIVGGCLILLHLGRVL
jgi:hypothetical protein